MVDLNGKVALVTGGLTGIGEATVKLFAEAGAHVFIGGRHAPRGTALAQAVGGTFLHLDVTSEDSWKQGVADIVQSKGGLDILVNAAGTVGDVAAGHLQTATLSDWRQVMAVNVDGVFLGCREVMPLMKQRGRGSIVNVASVGAYYPTTQSIAYGASKGAVTQLTKTVALTGSEDGAAVRCNSVHPGRIATPMLETIARGRQQRATGSGASDIQSSIQRMPLGPAGTPKDVAQLIAFLASDEASYITGSEFSVDGGWQLLR